MKIPFYKYYLTLIAFLILLTGCQTDINSYGEYVIYLNNSENGLRQNRSINGLDISIKYLPLDYLVLNELRHEDNNINNNKITELKAAYEHSTTFLMTLGPSKTEEFDVTKIGVSNYQEFTNRILSMTYGLKEQITLELGNVKHKPALAQLEELFGLQNKRNILLVFNLTKSEQNELSTNDFSISYKDEIFNTGNSQFLFKSNDLKKLPKVDYSKI